MINFSEKAYEMCLMDYDFAILDNAFLIHTPGIKLYNREERDKRKPYIILNYKAEAKIMSDLNKKYGTRNNCKNYEKSFHYFHSFKNIKF
jgi:hypothetical protein